MIAQAVQTAIDQAHHFEVLVGLLAGILAILSTMTAVIWKASAWLHEQTEATRQNTQAIRQLRNRLHRIERLTGAAKQAAADAPAAIARAVREAESDG